MNTTFSLLLLSVLLGACTATSGQDLGREERSRRSSAGGELSLGSCVEQYSPQTLRNRQYALDGVVKRIEPVTESANGKIPGDALFTLEVNKWFKGGSETTVTLKNAVPAGTAVTSAEPSGPSLREGKRYLVSGDGDFIWSCGFTAEFSEALAAEWDAALR